MSVPVPEKRIVSNAHLQVFLESQTFQDVVHFIEALNASVIGVKTTEHVTPCPNVQGILSIISAVSDISNATPPVENAKSRFGNPAFRTFYDQVQSIAPELHRKHLPSLEEKHIPELCVYFSECWGNRERIDYGSGMELNFLCWLLCLSKLGLLQPQDHKALVIRVFCAYLSEMRHLQSIYWLEPAGSHGVWGLDDYAFLPFLFGSAQLIGHKYIKPKSIHNADILDQFSQDYMYLACIKFINSIKTASLVWHSPMLNDISAVKTWDKINQGMLKMYKAEVLSKLPVAQHFYFGSLLPYPLTHEEEAVKLSDANAPPTDAHGHIHVRGEMWGDCCGIKVPSAFAAAQAEHAKEGRLAHVPLANGNANANIRRVPFD